MDKALYISSAGATLSMRAQQVHANNLTNSNTLGFRRDFVSSLSVALQGDGFQSRIMSSARGLGSSFDVGAQEHTGRKLDAVVSGDGWFTVETIDGNEAYTRAGQFQVSADGQLLTAKGLPVMGDAGPVQLPEFESIEIAGDGTITIIPADGTGETVEVGQLKLVNPEVTELQKAWNGLFVSANGEALDADPNVRLRTGFLETSNVSAMDEMISFISLSRQFESQMKMMKAAGDLASSGDRLIREQ
ncbi:flagellar basal body rod protein FlgF [Endozoicomonas ascidiicola]|uniref:flagellar basal body rod protein FlgF n=1 Tax=Endozoicomonas ascidiicola TaxID=1698521 RepID=UPI00082E79D8|nr:flagellar basal body rod protein FlgF [Endozoicomonas ascidiicola]